jgi:hypothetical protein
MCLLSRTTKKKWAVIVSYDEEEARVNNRKEIVSALQFEEFFLQKITQTRKAEKYFHCLHFKFQRYQHFVIRLLHEST